MMDRIGMEKTNLLYDAHLTKDKPGFDGLKDSRRYKLARLLLDQAYEVYRNTPDTMPNASRPRPERADG